MLTIKTDRKWKEIIFKEEETGFMYYGQFHNLNEFVRFNSIWTTQYPIKDYHAIRNDSASSGMLVKINDSGDAVIIARYYV